MKEKQNEDAYQGVWVFVEVWEGEPARVSLELMGKGRELADKLGVGLSGFLLGDSVTPLCEGLIAYGADRVIMAEDPRLKEYETGVYTDIIAHRVLKGRPEIFLLGATPVGRDLAPRLAMRLNTGCTADCTGLDIDNEMRLLVSTRPAFGGNVMATIVCPEHRPQMSTVRPGTMGLPDKDLRRSGEIEKIPVEIDEEGMGVEVVESVKGESAKIKMEEAERIVAIGMGAGDVETFQMIEGLAKALHAEVGATRMAVEAGWISHDHQVGQTGKNVKPALYIACGISGSVQHTAGMSGSKVVIAINRDPDAEIFKYSDYGIVGDVRKIVPPLIRELKRMRES